VFAHIHEALAQVRRLQDLVLEKRMFRGYSGKARITSGLLVLLNAAALSHPAVPRTAHVHLAGWAVTVALGVLVNYAALGWWFLFAPEVKRNPRMLRPAVDAVPALAVGAVLTVALVIAEQYDLLFGAWLSVYGLAQTAYRQSLPPGMYRTGLLYVLAGAVFLLGPAPTFLHPWPMAWVFFAGELVSGAILLSQGRVPQEPAHDN
jgi:hypothetical protein